MKPQAAYECNGALIAPEAFYAIACDPQRSVAVEACAGAGKTWMLVSRMVRALLEDANQAGPDDALQPQEILAITFTKRAAGEMRERLYEWLADFARADNATLLKIYALYKQGSSGDNEEKKPSFSDMVARAKWDAWAKLKGTSPEDAMQQYVDLIAELS